MTPDAWIAVNRAALRHNAAALQTLLAQGTDAPPVLIAVVKANAYGHGAGETACILQSAGVDFFAVTTPAEALELRAAGITARILVFVPPLPDQLEELIAQDVEVTVCDAAGAASMGDAAQDKTARVHLKIDTGMGRLGALPQDALPLAKRLEAVAGVEIAGVYTHFARALEPDSEPTRRQFARFQETMAELERGGISTGLRHCANSAALLRFPEMRLDAVRPGTLLYGQYPSASVPRGLELKDTWRMEARVVSVRDVLPGTAIGYGGEYVTRRRSRLAVLPVGLCRWIHRRARQCPYGVARNQDAAARYVPARRGAVGENPRPECARAGAGPDANMHRRCHGHSRRRGRRHRDHSCPADHRQRAPAARV